MNDPGPCRCWTHTWSPHDGHCCFHRDSPENCHDTEAADGRRTRHHRGNLMAARYWLTEKGWTAAGGRTT